jgi:NADPH2:quinone reductase
MTMKALRLTREAAGSVPVLTLETVSKPKVTPNHLLVKVYASAIHPSDIINARGLFPYTTFPRIPGRDYAGVIAEGPANRIGEEVYGTSGVMQAFTVDGAQAEYMLLPEAAVAPKPKNLSFAQAACIGVPFTTASLILRRSAAKTGDYVLVLGANGAVGSVVVQLAKAMGCHVLSATRNDKGDVNTAKDPELNAVDTLTDGKGVDVVADTVGQPALLQAAIKKLATGGRLAFIAAPRTGSTEVAIECTGFYRMEKSIVGCNTLLYSVDDFAKEMAKFTVSFEKGLLKGATPDEWTEVKLDDAVEAYGKAGQRGAGKFVIVMQ